MRPHDAHRIVPFLAAVGLVLALGACAAQSASSPQAGQDTTSGPALGVSATASLVPVTPASASTAPARTATAVASPSALATGTLSSCKSSQVAITLTHSGAALGTVGGFLTFTNHGSVGCTLTGWPTVTAITAAGDRTTVAHEYVTFFAGWTYERPIPVVTVLPGKFAYAALTDSDLPVGGAASCPPSYTRLQVAIPGGSPVTISGWLSNDGWYLPGCVGITGAPDIQVSGIGPSKDLPDS
jgi:hypothetical protein